MTLSTIGRMQTNNAVLRVFLLASTPFRGQPMICSSARLLGSLPMFSAW